MERGKDIIIIPDIHGRDFWEEATARFPEGQFVFHGDYLDPYYIDEILNHITSESALNNFQEILAFAKDNPGRVTLLLGNHDMKQIGQGFMQRFAHVTQQMTIRVGGQSIVLNHNPFLAYGGAYRNVWQLFGHVHSGPLSGKGKDGDSGSRKDLPRLSMLFPRQYDVGVDNNDFRPVSFAEVKTIIQHQINLKNE